MGLLDLIPGARATEPKPEAKVATKPFERLAMADGASGVGAKPERVPTRDPQREADRLEFERKQAEINAAIERDPATCRLEELTISLDPRAPLDQAIANVRDHLDQFDLDRANFDSEGEFQAEIKRAAMLEMASEIMIRTRDMLEGYMQPVEGTSRRTRACPVCNGGPLVLAFVEHEVRGRCLAGCSVRDLSRALTREVRAGEASNVAAGLGDEIARLTAELSPCAEPPRPHPWLVPGLAPERALTLWIAPTESMKTWLAIHTAICVAAGIPFLGRPTIRKRVMLALLEASEINAARIEPIARGLGVNMADLKGWLFVRKAPIKTDDPRSTAELATYIRTLGIELLLIDNYKLIRTPRGQFAANDETVAAAAVEPLETLAHDGRLHEERVGRPCAVVLLVHGKDGKPRGSDGPLEHADWVLELDKSKRDPEAPVTIDTAPGCRLAHAEARTVVRYVGRTPGPVVPELVNPTKPATPELGDGRKDTIAAIVRDLAPVGLNAICDELTKRTGKTTSKRDVSADLEWLEEKAWITRGDDKKYTPGA